MLINRTQADALRRGAKAGVPEPDRAITTDNGTLKLSWLRGPSSVTLFIGADGAMHSEVSMVGAVVGGEPDPLTVAELVLFNAVLQQVFQFADDEMYTVSDERYLPGSAGPSGLPEGSPDPVRHLDEEAD